MDIKRGHLAKLWNLNALVEDLKVLLRNAFLFFTQKEDAFGGEAVIVTQLVRRWALFQAHDFVPVGFLIL